MKRQQEILNTNISSILLLTGNSCYSYYTLFLPSQFWLAKSTPKPVEFYGTVWRHICSQTLMFMHVTRTPFFRRQSCHLLRSNCSYKCLPTTPLFVLNVIIFSSKIFANLHVRNCKTIIFQEVVKKCVTRQSVIWLPRRNVSKHCKF